MANYRSDQIRTGDIHGWHVYLIEEEGGAFCKIGRAATVARRLSGLQSGNARRLAVAKSWHLDTRAMAVDVENLALTKLTGWRVPKTEWIRGSSVFIGETVEEVIKEIGAVIRTSTAPRWS
jgi:hypothetical protein